MKSDREIRYAHSDCLLTQTTKVASGPSGHVHWLISSDRVPLKTPATEHFRDYSQLLNIQFTHYYLSCRGDVSVMMIYKYQCSDRAPSKRAKAPVFILACWYETAYADGLLMGIRVSLICACTLAIDKRACCAM